MSAEHDVEVMEDDEGSTFAYCRTCKWMGHAFEDRPTIDDEQPPVALSQAYDERYGHLYRAREGQL